MAMSGGRSGALDGDLRLLVCDLDGTLLEADGSISDRTRSALGGVRAAGIRVVVATWTGKERYQAALDAARRRLGDRYTITSGDNRSIELLPRGVDKGRAAGELARWMGLSLEQVGAIGDGTNDIELLSVAHRSVAMRHARPEVQAAADLVVPDGVPDDA